MAGFDNDTVFGQQGLDIGAHPSTGTPRGSFEFADAGSEVKVQIRNTSDTAGSDALQEIRVAGTSSGDPYLTFAVGSTTNYAFGLDNSDSDKLKISESSTIGTSDRVALTPGNDGNLVVTLDDHGQTIIGSGTTAAQAANNFHKFAVSQSVVNGTIVNEVNNNDNTSVGSSASLNIYVGGANAGDPYTYYDIPSVTGWVTGIDNSDSDIFKIGTGAALTPSTTTVVWKSTTAGEINMPLQPAFFAYLGTDDLDVTGTGTSYTLGSGNALTETYDQNGDFNTNGTFTAPVTGKYLLMMRLTFIGCTIATIFTASIVTSNHTYSTVFIKAAGNQDETISMFTIADMDALDTATAVGAVTGEAGDTVDVDGNANPDSFFTGYLCC